MKTPLLFLCHRIPYPPNKGDKIRSWNLLRHLANRYRVFLGTFVDDPEDWQHTDMLEDLCSECCFVPLHPLTSKVKSLRALLSAGSLSESYYYSRTVAAWVDARITGAGIGHAVIFSSSMAQYILPYRDRMDRVIVDFVDIDSDKWRQYSDSKRWPLSWLYRRESRTLRDFEVRIAEACDASLFVSPAEADHFRAIAPGATQKIDYYLNGVDREYFDPAVVFENPYPAAASALVFTGAMDYWPNVDAVDWFAKEVFPLIRRIHPRVGFYIVGSNPARAVQELARIPGVHVTGRVKDTRPYLQHALAAVAPMRLGRGIQNKVLEAMAMARPVIVSGLGIEGIHARNLEEVLIASNREDYVNFVSQLLAGEYSHIGDRALRKITTDFNWHRSLPIVDRMIEPPRETHAAS